MLSRKSLFSGRMPWLMLIAAVAIILVITYFHDPEQNWWSPKCIMLTLTGYKCPGCGIQRFAYHLMHGDVMTAIHYNYFAAALSPYLLLLASGELSPSEHWRETVHKRLANRTFGYIYLTLYFAWWVLRNILEL